MADYPYGLPGIKTDRTTTPRHVLLVPQSAVYFAGSNVIDGTKSADALNTPDIDVLRAGLLMGKITSGGKYANSIIGNSTGALTGTGTSLSAAAGTVTELVRRVGASGTFKLTGPPTAAGTCRTLTVTYSAASGTTITITALQANQVEQVNFNAASTAGNLQLRVQKPDGTYVTTANIAWNATDATYLAAINSALDTATGVTAGIVATAISAVDTDLGFVLTYSGTGYAGLPWARAQVAVFPTSSSAAVYTPVTTAVDGRFVTASLIQPTDGSETPLGILNETTGLKVSDLDGTRNDVMLPKLLIGGVIDSAQILNWPADTSTRAYIFTLLNQVGKFTSNSAL